MKYPPMKIKIRVKSLTKRKPLLDLTDWEVADDTASGEVLIEQIVRQNVRQFNIKAVDAPLFRYLSVEEIADAAEIGKISFGDKKNENKQNEDDAVKNALTCYRDGIFKLLVNETNIEPDTKIVLNENDIITFIRLVMLAGRRW